MVDFMRQNDINNDLGSYLHAKKDKPFWKKDTIKIKPRHEFDDEVVVRHEIERAELHKDDSKPVATHHDTLGTTSHHELKPNAVRNVESHHEDVTPQHENTQAHHETVEIHHDIKPIVHKTVLEPKVEEYNDIQTKITVDEPKEEGGLKKFFKKLSFSKDEEDDGPRQIGHMEMSDNPEITMDDEELRELLHGLHNWIIQLPSDKLERFKTSKEFELYTKYLRKHNLIK